ncbi:hypothetical protein V6N12_037956 [Hibiscus sabdariffa]|uniref:Uncharacterized protein n=1 Tax=Hibiscus sabdariffa TaxID=183260 RepID=A0ABR2BDH6_9ROSI
MKIYSSGKHHAGGKDQAQRKITISGIGIAEDLYFVIQVRLHKDTTIVVWFRLVLLELPPLMKGTSLVVTITEIDTPSEIMATPSMLSLHVASIDKDCEYFVPWGGFYLWRGLPRNRDMVTS